MRVLLDTHVWIRWLVEPASLPLAERSALARLAGEQSLCLPAIALWEAQVLHAKGRISLPLPLADWLHRATIGVLAVLPLDVDVVVALDTLPRSFHGDPADRLIVATARAHAMPLATHDKAIRRSRAVALWRPS